MLRDFEIDLRKYLNMCSGLNALVARNISQLICTEMNSYGEQAFHTSLRKLDNKA
jgi:hypothetical protein